MKQHPTGRTLAEFKPLKPAEAQLLEACKSGLPANLGDSRPTAGSDANTVRADFLRFLALGGSDEAPIHERGIQLNGAWVKGELDLTNATVPTSLAIHHSHFESRLLLNRAEVVGAFSLMGSQVPGLGADGLMCHDDVFLSNGFTTAGQVRLLGAQVGGDLACRGAKLNGKDGDALSADAAVIEGSVFLDDGFTASGEVRLLGAQIGGNLACEGATFQSTTGASLAADGLVVNGSFFFRELKQPVHRVSLASARVGRLNDDADAWGDDVVLDGLFTSTLAAEPPPTQSHGWRG